MDRVSVLPGAWGKEELETPERILLSVADDAPHLPLHGMRLTGQRSLAMVPLLSSCALSTVADVTLQEPPYRRDSLLHPSSSWFLVQLVSCNMGASFLHCCKLRLAGLGDPSSRS